MSQKTELFITSAERTSNPRSIQAYNILAEKPLPLSYLPA
jgi:hypothetical protein